MTDYGMGRADMVYGFSGLHPRLSLLYFIVLLGACMMFQHPVYLLASFLCIIALLFSLDGGRALKKVIKGYLLIAFIILISNPLFSSRGATILFYVWDRPVTLEAIVYGAIFALSLLNILLAFVAFNLVVTPDKLLYLLTPYAPRTAFVITVTLRFVPLLTRRLQQIMTIQKVMGYLQSGGNKKLLMREGMETLHTLVGWSLEEALQTASSMRARGYGIGRRSSGTAYRMDRRDSIVLWIMIITGLNVAIGAFFGVNQYEVYPRLQALHWSFQLGIHLFSYGIFIAIPLVMNGKEWLHWRIIRSSM
ncbi:energy-coupling factor transporter transmembrane component T [Paenibacillus lentus]|uniref:energy-coupling factor transporter transmembrane component T n=1 Tax=Paenibacillus lentus TaxID=1338368 RepID=UPI0036D214C2